ncbi:MAG: DUF2306 domain-containing protein [Longimicrobiales bacterium]
MTPIGAVHFLSSLVAITMGAVVLMLPKGTRWHRTWGHGYVWSMVVVVATSFALFNMTGRWTPFHFAAVAGGVTLLGGMITVLRRVPKKEWIEAHATWMAWSYVGLMAAFTAESLTRFVMPRIRPYLETNALFGVFWIVVALGSFSAGAVGWWLIKTRLPAAVASTPAAMRQEREELRGAGAGDAVSA